MANLDCGYEVGTKDKQCPSCLDFDSGCATMRIYLLSLFGNMPQVGCLLYAERTWRRSMHGLALILMIILYAYRDRRYHHLQAEFFLVIGISVVFLL